MQASKPMPLTLSCHLTAFGGKQSNKQQASGIQVNPEVVETFNTLKIKHTVSYAIFCLSDDLTEIIVQKTSDSGSYDEFLSELPSVSFFFPLYASNQSSKQRVIQSAISVFHHLSNHH